MAMAHVQHMKSCEWNKSSIRPPTTVALMLFCCCDKFWGFDECRQNRNGSDCQMGMDVFMKLEWAFLFRMTRLFS